MMKKNMEYFKNFFFRPISPIFWKNAKNLNLLTSIILVLFKIKI